MLFSHGTQLHRKTYDSDTLLFQQNKLFLYAKNKCSFSFDHFSQIWIFYIHFRDKITSNHTLYMDTIDLVDWRTEMPVRNNS